MDKLDQIREFCNTVPVGHLGYDLACDIRDFIDGETETLP